LDKNGDGKISFDEGLLHLKPTSEKDKIETLARLDKMDKNHNQAIEPSEFDPSLK